MGKEVVEYLLLRHFFGGKDKKRMMRLRDQLILDMNYNVQSSIVTKATKVFKTLNHSQLEEFKESQLCEQIKRDPAARDDELDTLASLFDNLRFMDNFKILETPELKEFALTSMRLRRVKKNERIFNH